MTIDCYNGVAALGSGQTVTVAGTETTSDGPDDYTRVISYEFSPSADGLKKVIMYMYEAERERCATYEIEGGKYSGAYDVTDFMTSGQPQG